MGAIVRRGFKPRRTFQLFTKQSYDRAMGLFCTPSRLYLSSKSQLWQLDNVLEGHLYQGYDRLYIPRIAHTTRDIAIRHSPFAIPDYSLSFYIRGMSGR